MFSLCTTHNDLVRKLVQYLHLLHNCKETKNLTNIRILKKMHSNVRRCSWVESRTITCNKATLHFYMKTSQPQTDKCYHFLWKEDRFESFYMKRYRERVVTCYHEFFALPAYYCLCFLAFSLTLFVHLQTYYACTCLGFSCLQGDL